MKSLKSVFLSGGVLSRTQMAKLHKTWRWEREGYVATTEPEPGLGYILTKK